MNRKKIFLVWLIIIATLFGGCRSVKGSESGPDPEAQDDGIKYAAEFIPFQEYSNISAMAAREGAFYFSAPVPGETDIRGIFFYTATNKEGETLLWQAEAGETVLKIAIDTYGGVCFVSAINSSAGDSQELFLKNLNQAGEITGNYNISDALNLSESIGISFMETDEEDNIYLQVSSSDESRTFILDKAGNLIGDIDNLGLPDGMCRGKDGNIYAAYRTPGGLGFQKIDYNKKVPEETVMQFEQPPSRFCLGEGLDQAVMVSTGEALYEYDPASGSQRKVLDWVDYYVSGDGIRLVTAAGEDSILTISIDFSDPVQPEAVLLKPIGIQEEPVPEKKVLTYGVMGGQLDSDVETKILEFNRDSEKYEIKIKKYGDGNPINGAIETNQQFQLDIITGNCPDIIALPIGHFQQLGFSPYYLGFPLEQYAGKGIFEDLHPYMERDDELKKEDFLENIIHGYETEGKLYAMPANFFLLTLSGKKSEVEDKTNWNLEEMIDYVDNHPQKEKVFYFGTKEDVLNICLTIQLSQLVDWNREDNFFDRELLIKILEFANGFEDINEYEFCDKRAEELWLDNSLFGIGSFHNIYNFLADEVTLVGYPSKDGNGSRLMTRTAHAISSDSTHKDVAWEFIRTLLKEDFQKEIWESDFSIFPVRKDAFEEYFKSLAEELPFFNTGTIEVVPPPPEQWEMLKETILNVDTPYSTDIQLYNIIWEEAQSYFTGAKTVAEAVDIMENRISLYVKETK